jgi:formylglycine-generating enzyme required for sulfatase activity
LVVITYGGSTTPPTSAGNYAVVATIDDPLYEGSESGTLTIQKASQAITFNTIADQAANAGVLLSATGGDSTQPVTFSVTGPAVLNGGNLSFIGAGEVTVTASQSGDANYLSAPPVERTFQVSKANASVTLGSLNQTYDGTPRPVSATTSPGGKTVLFTYGGSSSAPAGAGTYEVVGTINDAIYEGSGVGTLVIAKAIQEITFSAISDQIATAEVTLSASGGGSGNPVTFQIAGPAQLNGNVLSFTGAGEVSVTANLAGDSNYLPANLVIRTFQVTKAPATISLELLSQTYDGTPRSVTATTTPAGLTVLFAYGGSPEPPAAAGSYGVTGTISDPRYEGNTSGTLVVAKAAQVIQFSPVGDQLATALVTLSASGGGSGNAVIFDVVSGPATVTGTQLTFSGPGTVMIGANQAGNANFEPAPGQQQAIEVTAALVELLFSRLHQVADGTIREIAVETIPPGVATAILYDGAAAAPTEIGTYSVVVEVVDPRYEGSKNGTLVVDDPARVMTISGGSLPSQSPLGSVRVPTFQVGAYEVTGAQWNTIIAWAEANAGYQFEGAGSAMTGDRPVTGLNWYDAAKWCNARTEWENAVFGRSFAPAYTIEGVVFRSGNPASPDEVFCDFGTSGYRLPTASEWELAARGGAAGATTVYPGGDVLDPLGWYSGNSGEAQASGGKSANSAGLYDLAGNAAEWVWDAIPGSPLQRGLRGGSWLSSASSIELAVFTGEVAGLRRTDAGLRLVRSVSSGLQDALDNPDLSWETSADHPWLAQQGETFVDQDAAESPALTSGRNAWIETGITGPVNLHFRWQTSGLGAEDTAVFLVDGAPSATPESNGDWAVRSVEIGPGDHLLRWRITSGTSSGTARFWIDEVAYESATVADLSSATVSGISGSSVTLGGEVTSDGGRTVTERGFVYAIMPEPTVETAIELVVAGSGPGSFQADATDLSEGTTYYARAYATNNLGTAYGDSVRFTTDTHVNFSDGVSPPFTRDIYPGDRQIFRLALTGPRFVNFSTTGDAALRAELFDSEGNLITTFDGDANFDLEELLLAGGYVLHVFREGDGGTVRTYDLTIDASVVAASRPDLAVGASPAALSGVGLYAPASQAAALISKKAKAVTGYASLSNRGNLPDVLAARATGGSALFAVSYFGPAGNVTAGLLTGTYVTPEMNENDTAIVIRASITPNKKKLTKKKGKKVKILKKTHVLSLRVSSSFDPTIGDAAVISARTK